jgi:3-dehydroquinate synthase
MKKIEIELKNDQYNILYARLSESIDYIKSDFLNGKTTAIIADTNSAQYYLSKLEKDLLDINQNVIKIILSPGEKNKDLTIASNVIDDLLSKKFERSDTIIALGGGVIGDLAGFVAAIIHRGVSFINIPTTLLSQVDSSIGGKTGVNTKYGKNLIGSFKQPKIVICDTEVLSTLPQRELLAGYTELVKHSLIKDANLFNYLDINLSEIFKDNKVLQEAIYRSSLVKAEIVMQDVLEQNIRAHLNLGHTFGHAIEALFRYDGTLLHGEAISIGIMMAFSLAEKISLCDPSQTEAVKKHFDSIGLKTNFSGLPNNDLTSKNLIELMKNDKKVRSGSINFILPKDIGSVDIFNGIDDGLILEVLELYL